MDNLIPLIKYVFPLFFLEVLEITKCSVPCTQLLFAPNLSTFSLLWLINQQSNKWLMFAIGSFHLWTSKGKSNHTNWCVADRLLPGVSGSYEALGWSPRCLSFVNNLDNGPGGITCALRATFTRRHFYDSAFCRKTATPAGKFGWSWLWMEVRSSSDPAEKQAAPHMLHYSCGTMCWIRSKRWMFTHLTCKAATLRPASVWLIAAWIAACVWMCASQT